MIKTHNLPSIYESLRYYPPIENNAPEPSDEALRRLQAAVCEVFNVTATTFGPVARVSARFDGAFLVAPEAAYDQLDAAFAPLGHTPVFREENGEPVVLAMRGRFNSRPWPVWPNVLLLALTVLSTLSVGASIAMSQQDIPINDVMDVYANLLMGWPYALSLILILGAHEMGHFIAARWHKVPASWPYFIPLPFPVSFFGTLGAVIVQRAPARNARRAFDVGVAGPLAGMLFAVPILLIGLATSPVEPVPSVPYLLEGNSILYAMSKFLVFGRFLPDGRFDVFINQLAQAGWTGLFVTGLNLIPVGQLDGGHVLHALLGEWARRLYWPVMAVMVALALLVSPAWYLWVLLLLLFGRVQVPPLDAITRVDDGRRRALALLAFMIFILVFTPNPMEQIIPQGVPLLPTV
ncbi:MAG: site-2 protease family protein [Anaerolineae bacterium]|nr:site-2 protease family protein [Anaerolineae bacterium]